MQQLSELSGAPLQDAINASQFDPQSSSGFYESYFLRANHPTQPQAFWIRYTLFRSSSDSENSVAQLWAVYFDGNSKNITTVKQTLPLQACSFSRTRLAVQIGQATLDKAGLRGQAASAANQVIWDLSYDGTSAPSFLLPLPFYSRAFPKAKVLTGLPLADFNGSIDVNGTKVIVDGWRGSQNHNWGSRHTDSYAWGQVAGFDNDPDAFLECSTARLRIGSFWTPWFTNVVLRFSGKEFLLNSLMQSLLNRGHYRCFDWTISCTRGPVRLTVAFTAPPERFVGLGYDDPPGGTRTCLNTKLAACSVHITENGSQTRLLHTASRAAFEIMTTTEYHGIALSA
jgi:hypothetical protein